MSKLTAAEKKGLVVFAGWLGCETRYLRRYEAFYQKKGWDVIMRIATPAMVLESASNPPTEARGKPESLWSLALDTLEAISQHKSSTRVIFHVFSNGGCFLWEQIRYLLWHMDRNVELPLDDLRRKMSGVVFDSSPARYGGDDASALVAAIMHIPYFWERSLALSKVLYSKLWNSEQQKEQLTRRASSFWMGMRNDPWHLRQLYIYSKNDNLTNAEALDELVEYRKSIVGSMAIQSLRLEQSPHCSHILTNPKQYYEAVENFLKTTSTTDTFISKL